MVAVLYTDGCIFLSLTAGPLSVSHSNGKIPALFLYASKWVTEQNVAIVVASPFSLWQAKCWQKSCSPVFSSTLLILPCMNLNAGTDRSTIDMIFASRQLQDKCREQHQDLCIAFADQTKAFDTVNCDLLWNILRKFGCPHTFIGILQQFHTGMCAQVDMAGSQPSSLSVEVGVKQGCVLASTCLQSP